MLTMFIAFMVLFSSFALIAQANTNNPVNAETHYGIIVRVDLSRHAPPVLIDIEDEDGNLHIHRLADVFILDAGGRGNRHMVYTDYDVWGPVYDVRDFENLLVRYRVTNIGASGIGTIDLIELIDPLPPGRSIRPIINYRASGWSIRTSEDEPIITINHAYDERIIHHRDGFSFEDYFLVAIRRNGLHLTSARDIGEFIDIILDRRVGFYVGPLWPGPPPPPLFVIEIPRAFENSYIWVEINGDRRPIVSPPGPKPPPPQPQPPPEPYPDIIDRVIFASPYDWQVNNLNIQDANWGLNAVRIHSATDVRITPRRTEFSFDDYFLVIISGWDTSTASITSLYAIRDSGYELNFELITEHAADPGGAVMVPWFKMIEIPVEFLDRDIVMGDIRIPGISLPEPAPTPPNNSEIRVLLNGTPIEFDVPPQIIDNRTMVPFRAIFEALGFDVEWDGEEQSIFVPQRHGAIKLWIDSNVMMIWRDFAEVYEEKITLDVPPMIVDNRALVPLRAVSEAINAEVEWDEDTRTVSITQN
ncbi:MAG: copper amine oxidase N-terminal domain-containing protein [Oscillospiraceae bacterium]|nr:copper amine oxidase N-terminal domain-containing protein [Oscillospiraceae bacterium]